MRRSSDTNSEKITLPTPQINAHSQISIENNSNNLSVTNIPLNKSRNSVDVKETLDAKVNDESGGQRKLNQYILGKILGKGSFGTVYKAIDENTRVEYAIKEFSKTKLRKQKALKTSGGAIFARGRGRGRGGIGLGITRAAASESDENPIELVRGEIAILKKLNHINVVKLFEVLDDPSKDSLFMVFELCGKGCLMDISMGKTVDPLSTIASRRYFRQMILGIEYLHENNICHRDIKPDNMMITNSDTIKIVDFGVSEIFTPDNEKIEKSAGSPAFYPPEICTANHGQLAVKPADLWAMGVTLYCMMFGKLPFVGQNILQIYDSIRNDPLVIPKEADPTLQELLIRLLDKNPETRMTMDELRINPWVTENGNDLLISKDENCNNLVLEITDSDLDTAIKPIANIFTIMKAISKLKNFGKGSTENE